MAAGVLGNLPFLGECIFPDPLKLELPAPIFAPIPESQEL